MNIKIKKLMVFIWIFFSTNAFAQSAQSREQQEMERQMNEIMKARQEMIKSLLDDSGFQGFDKQFEDMIKRFDNDSFGTAAEVDSGEVVGEYDWRETATQQILVLKVKQIKNKPLDIKIEKGQIILKGDVESVDLSKKKVKKISKVHFERTFGIPDGVDQTNPEFEQKDGELLIKFKKLKVSKIPPKEKAKQLNDQRRPIGKDEGDLTI